MIDYFLWREGLRVSFNGYPVFTGIQIFIILVLIAFIAIGMFNPIRFINLNKLILCVGVVSLFGSIIKFLKAVVRWYLIDMRSGIHTTIWRSYSSLEWVAMLFPILLGCIALWLAIFFQIWIYFISMIKTK